MEYIAENESVRQALETWKTLKGPENCKRLLNKFQFMEYLTGKVDLRYANQNKNNKES